MATGLSLPSLIGDGMVVQQGKPIRVWGRAAPGAEVSVSMAGRKGLARADAAGAWSLEMEPLEAGGPHEMLIAAGDETARLKDVLVGEVWVCSGQSNMEWPMTLTRDSTAEVAAANHEMIRLFRVPRGVARLPQDRTGGAWQRCTPANIAAGESFSAVGYFFGRELHRQLGVPVGLIHSAWGGSPIEAWTPLETLRQDAELSDLMQTWERMVAGAEEKLDGFVEQFSEWRRRAAEAERDGSAPPAPPLVDDPRQNHWRPGGLFNAMIAPLTRIGVCGAIWYQGESNVGQPERYARLLPAMIRSWRKAWDDRNLAFVFVQLPNYGMTEPPHETWAYMREAQLAALDLPRTGMAVTIDVGDTFNIHPPDKLPVGERLARAALSVAYGRDVLPCGPLYDGAAFADGLARVRFRHAGDGLASSDGGPLRGFAVAGQDRRFFPAEATIEGGTVCVRSARVPGPVAVRYAWADDPDCNLCNTAGLPASPFRSDRWPRAGL